MKNSVLPQFNSVNSLPFSFLERIVYSNVLRGIKPNAPKIALKLDHIWGQVKCLKQPFKKENGKLFTLLN
jgi:hypothetical protein